MKNILIRLSVVAALATGSTLVVNTERAEALGWWRSTYVGRATISDNGNYARAIGRMSVPTPPWDRNALCAWKFGNPREGKIEGRSAGWNSWDTNCFNVVWKFWWQ
jgi:hypothetical protein